MFVLERHSGPRGLLVLAAAVAALSAPVFCTRFLNDMEYYTLVANKLLRGGILYRDAIDTKPPMVFLHYAAIFTVFGRDNIGAVKVVTILWLALSAWLVARIYAHIYPDAAKPQRAALLFVLASFSGWGEDFLSSNTEILANLFVIGGVLCFAKDGFGQRRRWLALGGSTIGVAFLYRYQSGAALAAYVFALFLVRKPVAAIARRVLEVSAGFIVPIAIFVGYYVVIDGLPDLQFFLRYQSYYLRPHSLYWPQVALNVAIVLLSAWPFLILAASQTSRLATRPSRTDAEWFLVLWTGWSVLPFFLGGHYYPHYFVQVLPPLTLLAARRLSQAESRSDTRADGFFFSRAPRIILANVVLFSLINVVYYRLRPAEPETPAVASFVGGHTEPDDRVFLWTWRPNLLLEIDRVYATRFLSNEFLIGRLYGTKYRLPTATAASARDAAVAELWPALLHDLEHEHPRLIVDDAPGRSNFTIEHYPALAALVREHYEPGRVMDGLCVYVRKAT